MFLGLHSRPIFDSLSENPGFAPAKRPSYMQNLHFKHLNESRISRNYLYNFHEIAYDTTRFVHTITHPDLVWSRPDFKRSKENFTAQQNWRVTVI